MIMKEVEWDEKMIEMIKKFQCCGCVNGPDPKTCPQSHPSCDYGTSCSNHVSGTIMSYAGNIFLGLPKGFDRKGTGETVVRLWAKGHAPDWDRFNVPVWAMHWEGYMLVRTFVPRLSASHIDVVDADDNTPLPDGAIDVGEFADEID